MRTDYFYCCWLSTHAFFFHKAYPIPVSLYFSLMFLWRYPAKQHRLLAFSSAARSAAA